MCDLLNIEQRGFSRISGTVQNTTLFKPTGRRPSQAVTGSRLMVGGNEKERPPTEGELVVRSCLSPGCRFYNPIKKRKVLARVSTS